MSMGWRSDQSIQEDLLKSEIIEKQVCKLKQKVAELEGKSSLTI